jgi:hypothetical protein
MFIPATGDTGKKALFQPQLDVGRRPGGLCSAVAVPLTYTDQAEGLEIVEKFQPVIFEVPVDAETSPFPLVISAFSTGRSLGQHLL